MKILITLIMAILISASPLYAKQNYRDQIASEINDLTIQGNYSCRILSISDRVDNFIAVALDPPYREFPNVILFNVNFSGLSLKRVYEALSLGIQDEPSKFLDLHTIGSGVDFTFEKDKKISIHDKQVRTAVEIFEKEGGTVTLYERFFHGHLGHRSAKHYLIDKTNYKKFALALLGEQYNEYPDQECMMYDTPNLKDMKFVKKGAEYLIEAKTSNKQKWTVSFKGVDAENKYLIDKVITVEKYQNGK